MCMFILPILIVLSLELTQYTHLRSGEVQHLSINFFGIVHLQIVYRPFFLLRLWIFNSKLGINISVPFVLILFLIVCYCFVTWPFRFVTVSFRFITTTFPFSYLCSWDGTRTLVPSNNTCSTKMKRNLLLTPTISSNWVATKQLQCKETFKQGKVPNSYNARGKTACHKRK